MSRIPECDHSIRDAGHPFRRFRERYGRSLPEDRFNRLQACLAAETPERIGAVRIVQRGIVAVFSLQLRGAQVYPAFCYSCRRVVTFLAAKHVQADLDAYRRKQRARRNQRTAEKRKRRAPRQQSAVLEQEGDLQP